MAAYATYTDVQSRMGKTFTSDEQALCTTLLDDASVIIDAYNSEASSDAKKVVACKMVIRAIGNIDVDVPIGATQGSMSALGYSQSWTMTNGSTGELFISKLEKKLLGYGNKIGTVSPVEDI